jgi:hypothetical protein
MDARENWLRRRFMLLHFFLLSADPSPTNNQFSAFSPSLYLEKSSYCRKSSEFPSYVSSLREGFDSAVFLFIIVFSFATKYDNAK